MIIFKRVLLSALHIAAVLAIMLVSQLLGAIVSELFSVNAIIDDLLYTAVYIGISLLLGYIYSKYILRIDFSVIGISKKATGSQMAYHWSCSPACNNSFLSGVCRRNIR